MTTATSLRPPGRTGQIVVVTGIGAGAGLETAHRAPAEGARIIVADRNPDPLERAAAGPGPLSSAALAAANPAVR